MGCTPLHRAASTGKSDLCEFLIEEGAEVESVDKAGETPLMTAVICENQKVSTADFLPYDFLSMLVQLSSKFNC